MNRLFCALVFLISTSWAFGATKMPASAVGIWKVEGAEFRGEALVKGEALYLDTDGVGGLIGSDGMHPIGIRVVVTSFDEATQTMGINLTESGKVRATGTLVLDSGKGTISFRASSMIPKNLFVRHSSSPMSQSMRINGLGLEPRQ